MRALEFRPEKGMKLEPAYVLSDGDEALKSYIREKFISLIPKEQRDFACLRIDASTKDINDIIFAADSFVFGGDKKIVFVDGLTKKLTKEDLNQLKKYFMQPNELATIVFENVGQNIEVLVGYATLIECTKAIPQEFYSYVFMKLRTAGYSMESSIISDFTKYCNYDFGKINSELDKLMLYNYESKVIKKEDYEMLTAIDLEIKVYDLTNALSRKQFESAIEIFNKLKVTAGGNEGLRMLFRILQSTYRRLFAILTSSLGDEDTAQALNMTLPALYVNKRIIDANKDRGYVFKVKACVEYLTYLESQLMTFIINEEQALNMAINRIIEIFNGK